MYIKTLISATTAAQTEVVSTQSNPNGYMSLVADGLGSGETITLECANRFAPTTATDSHWTQITIDGDDQNLDSDNTVRTFSATLLVRVKKPTTSSAVSVTVLRP
jgi:hypothetical protein